MGDGIVIVESDPAWPADFEAESRALRRVLGERALRVEHVGSTSVPGLAAKPVIDIQISVAELHPLADHAEALGSVGYVHVPLPPPPEELGLEWADETYPFFQKPAVWPTTHHVHLCASGSVEERNHIVFRDYLRDHPESVAEYLALKRELASAFGGESPESRERYSLGKTEFVAGVLGQALARGYSV